MALSRSPRVAVFMGSTSDLKHMKDAATVLKEFKIPFEMKVISAHRTPKLMARVSEAAAKRGIQVIIAGAGGAAHLPGMIAAHTPLPVIGVPVPIGPLEGADALLSIVQMPKGVPVATVAIGNSANAGILAVQILASGGAQPDVALLAKLRTYKSNLEKKVLRMKIRA